MLLISETVQGLLFLLPLLYLSSYLEGLSRGRQLELIERSRGGVDPLGFEEMEEEDES